MPGSRPARPPPRPCAHRSPGRAGRALPAAPTGQDSIPRSGHIFISWVNRRERVLGRGKEGKPALVSVGQRWVTLHLSSSHARGQRGFRPPGTGGAAWLGAHNFPAHSRISDGNTCFLEFHFVELHFSGFGFGVFFSPPYFLLCNIAAITPLISCSPLPPLSKRV